MNQKKKFNWRKILGYAATFLVGAGSLAGIGYGSYEIYKTTNISSDFSDGRSFQLDLRLFKTNDSGNVVVENNKPVKLYADEATEKKNIEDSARFLVNTLETKGLTNVEVTYGYSTIVNNQVDNSGKFVFDNGLEPVATLYAKFENLSSAFALNETTNEENFLINKMKVNDDLNNSISYEIDLVKPTYNSSNYPIPNSKTKTGRVSDTGIFATSKQTGQTSGDTMSYYDVNLMKDNKINVFVNKNGEESNSEVAYTLKSNLAFNQFNTWDFGEENYKYQEIYRASQESSSSSSGTDPNEAQKFQTTYTWFLWKDKQGCIDYLNSLIGLWYYNIYANIVPSNAFNESYTKDQILANLFPTADDPAYIRNGTNIETRKAINIVIDSLNTDEKSFIAWAVQQSRNSGVDTLQWTPPFITENDLIPVIYNFYNSELFSPSYIDTNNLANDNGDGVSESVKNGWSFLESTNTSLSSFLGDYYIGTIDYRNFNVYFEDPNDPKEATDEEPNPIPDPYATNSFIINSLDYANDAKTFANTLNNANYKFPVINSSINTLYTDWHSISNEYVKLNSSYKIGEEVENPFTGELVTLTKDIYHEWQVQFANKYFNGNNIFSNQFITPASIIKSFTKLNPLYVLLIIIASILLLVGIFVSVRYRIPGFLAFITSSIVFVVSVVIYNALGYVFSLYSVIALAIGTFLSFITPTFLFKNIKKEVSEGSTLSAAILKSSRKYWKMSLDTHVMSILASLAFLFFGKTSNVNLGSLLVISVFLSFIFSGIIYYILMLFYVYVVQFNRNIWYVSNKTFNSYKDFAQKNKKEYWLLNKVNYFTKYNYISIGIFALIAIVAIILLATIGPFISTDFSSSNVIIINYFDYFGITKQEVINALGINSIDAYVYDNQLVIYTLNNVSLSQVNEVLKELVVSKNPEDLNNLLKSLESNTLVTTLTSEALMKIINNALSCIGIAIGFCAVWSMLSLNIISIIPVAISQALSIFILVGFNSIVAIPVDISVVPIFLLLFMFVTIFSTSIISAIKSSWDRSILIKHNELRLLVNNIASKINSNYLFIICILLAFAILSMIFVSISLIFTFLTLIVCLIWLFIFNNVIVVNLWYSFVLLRDLFSKELIKSRKQDSNKTEYDEQNEQKIIGINC